MQKSHTFQLFRARALILFLIFMYYLCIWVISVKLLPYIFYFIYVYVQHH